MWEKTEKICATEYLTFSRPASRVNDTVLANYFYHLK